MAELRQLLLETRENAPAVLAREYFVQEAIGQETVFAAWQKPNLTVHARILGAYEYRDDLNGQEARAIYDGSVTGRQPIYHWGRLEAYRKVGRLRREQAELEKAHTLEESLWRIREQFLACIVAREKLAVAKSGQQWAGEWLAAQEEMLRNGRTTEQKLLEARLQQLQYSERAAQAENAFRRARATLEEIAGRPIEESFAEGLTIPALAPLTEQELAEIRQRILQAEAPNYQRERAELDLRAEKENYVAIAARAKPVFDLIAGAYQDQLDNYGSQDRAYRFYFFTGVQMTWNIFDGWETKGQKMTSLAKQRYAEIQIQRARSTAVRERTHLLGEIQQQMLTMQMREQSLALQQQRLALAEKQAQRNEISRQDWQRLQLEAEETRVQLWESRAHYWAGLCRLRAELEEKPRLSPRVP